MKKALLPLWLLVAAGALSTAQAEEAVYIIGNDQGWRIESDELKLTPAKSGDSLYEGSYMFGPAPYFRIYSALGNWNENSYGSQEEDASVTFYLNGSNTFNAQLVKGKGSFHLSDFPGGMMHFKYDINTLYLSIYITDDNGTTQTLMGGFKYQENVAHFGAQAPYHLYDMAGRAILSGEATHLDLHTLPSGIYILNVAGVSHKICR